MTEEETLFLHYYNKAPSWGKLAAECVLYEGNDLANIPKEAAEKMRDDLKGHTKGEYKRAIKHLRSVQSAARRDGDETTAAKFEETISFIRRELMNQPARA